MDNLSSLVMPHGPWFIYEPYARETWAALSRITIQAHEPEKTEHVKELRSEALEMRSARDEKPYAVSDGIAVFDLTGPMTKIASSFGGGTGTAKLRRLIEAAASDPDVKGGFLRVDSPGGSVAGTDDLARTVAAFARKKPIYAWIEDMGCSAAMWVAAQATKVYANPTALVGSLGTFAVVYDVSEAAEKAGVKAHVLSTGKYKGAGTPGAVITDEQLAQFQSNIDDFNEDFIAAIARGRGLSKAETRELFDGSAYKAPKGVKKGIIDQISSSERAVLDDLREVAYSRGHKDARSSFENSDEDGPLAGLTLAQETETLLAGVQVCINQTQSLSGRLAKLKSDRSEEGRDLGPKAIGHIDDATRQLVTLSEGLQALKPALKDEREDARKALARTLLDAEMSRAS